MYNTRTKFIVLDFNFPIYFLEVNVVMNVIGKFQNIINEFLNYVIFHL